MLIYTTLCAILILEPCLALPTAIPADKLLPYKDENGQFHEKIDIFSILNPLNGPNDGDERDFQEPDDLDATGPKITIWEFPTERRVFIGDIEVFVNSKEDDENSHEVIDPFDIFVVHPHKRNGLPKYIGDEKRFPAFKVKSIDDIGDINESNLYRYLIQNDGLRHSKLNRDKRNVIEDKEIDIKDEIVSGPPIKRPRRMWEFQEYLKWLLSNLDGADVSSDDKKDKEVDVNSTENPIKVHPDTEDEVLIDIKKPIDDTKKIHLVPVDPDLIKILLKDYNRGKRNIDSENDVNMIVDNTDEDRNADVSFDDFSKFIKTGQTLFDVLITVYYFRK